MTTPHAASSRLAGLFDSSSAQNRVGLAPLSVWTMPILRIGMALFLALWGVDKLLATAGAVGIFSRFYLVSVGTRVARIGGVFEILVALALSFGLFRIPIAWLVLVMNLLSMLASWKQILDPWGLLGLTKGGSHLFLASFVVTATSIVLVLNARDAHFTMDRVLSERGRVSA